MKCQFDRSVKVFSFLLALALLFFIAPTVAKAEGEQEEAPTYTLTFKPTSGASINIPAQSLKEGELASPVADPSKDGLIFVGWGTSINYTSPLWNFATSKMPAHDTVLYALFVQDQDEGMTLTIIVKGKSTVYKNLSTTADVIKFLPKIDDPNFLGWTAKDAARRSFDLTRYTSYAIGEGDMVITAQFDEAETPIGPVDPVDPVDPADPADPVNPVDPGKKGPDPQNPDTPKTADESTLFTSIEMMAALFAGMVMFSVLMKREQKRNKRKTY